MQVRPAACKIGTAEPVSFGRFSGLYVTVVVKLDEAAATGRVRTAYLTGRLGRGKVLWVHKP